MDMCVLRDNPWEGLWRVQRSKGFQLPQSAGCGYDGLMEIWRPPPSSPLPPALDGYCFYWEIQNIQQCDRYIWSYKTLKYQAEVLSRSNWGYSATTFPSYCTNWHWKECLDIWTKVPSVNHINPQLHLWYRFVAPKLSRFSQVVAIDNSAAGRRTNPEAEL